MSPSSQAQSTPTWTDQTNRNADHPSDDLEPEPYLISFDNPTPADLGDFTAVWQYLATHPCPRRCPTNPETNGIDVPGSGKQLREQLERKADLVGNEIKLKLAPQKKSALDVAALSVAPKSDKPTQSKSVQVKKTKKPVLQPITTSYSSPDDDPDDSPWYSSFFEDRCPELDSPRRKSFLYVPPSLYTRKPAPPTPKSKRLRLPTAPSASDRLRNLIQKLITKHPTEANTILLGKSPSSPDVTAKPSCANALPTLHAGDLHIFIDNSNILIGFYNRYKLKHDLKDPFFRRPELDFHAFSTILERGRPVSRKILVGSNPLIQPVLQAQRAGYEISILERVVDIKRHPNSPQENLYTSDSATRTPQRERKKEQAVDEILHLRILESILDVDVPGTIVLATGDAAPAEFSPEGGFLKCVERALGRGWAVELVCWRNSMSRLWRDMDFRLKWRNMFNILQLDDFVDELVLE